jgi:hypothetical protein
LGWGWKGRRGEEERGVFRNGERDA